MMREFGSANRTITGAVEDMMSTLVVAQLLYLEADNPKKEIAMYINSPGGVVFVRACDLRHDAICPPGGLHSMRRPSRLPWHRCCWPPARRTLVEQTNRGERAYDIFSRLLKERIIFINRSIDLGRASGQ